MNQALTPEFFLGRDGIKVGINEEVTGLEMRAAVKTVEGMI
jgi:hypothetical protein